MDLKFSLQDYKGLYFLMNLQSPRNVAEAYYKLNVLNLSYFCAS